MTGKRSFVIILAALAAILIAASLLYNGMKNTAAVPAEEPRPVESAAADDAQTEEESTAAPDFTMLDADGEDAALSDRLGRPIVLNFWASWCGPCQSEMPDFDALAAEYGDTVEFMMVNLTDGVRETEERAREFIDSQGYSFPVYFDVRSEGAEAYYVRSIPVTYFIDADGNIAAYHTGAMSADTLRQGIELISK